MSRFETTQIANLRLELAVYAVEFADFYYAELSCGAIADQSLLRQAVLALTGGQDFLAQYDAKGATCFYGGNIVAAVATLEHMTHRIATGIRLIVQQFSTVENIRPVPILRGERAPFAIAGMLMRLMNGFAEDLRERLQPLGVAFQIKPGAPRVLSGSPTMNEGGNVITFPGGIIASRSSDADWSKLVDAVSQSRLRVCYTLSSVFDLIGAFFEAMLVIMSPIEEENQEPGNAPATHSQEKPISPEEQASLLGWEKPYSSKTFQRLKSLRTAVIRRGMPLEEHRIAGRGNKTFVSRKQWTDVVELYQLIVGDRRSPDEALCAIEASEPLRNLSGKPRSYWCDNCSEVTRSSEEKPVCKKCRNQDKLRPISH